VQCVQCIRCSLRKITLTSRLNVILTLCCAFVCARCRCSIGGCDRRTTGHYAGNDATCTTTLLAKKVKREHQLPLTCRRNACTNVFARSRHATVRITYPQNVKLSMKGFPWAIGFIFGVGKLEWLGYSLVKVESWSTQSFGYNTSTWQTHRQPRRHNNSRFSAVRPGSKNATIGEYQEV